MLCVITTAATHHTGDSVPGTTTTSSSSPCRQARLALAGHADHRLEATCDLAACAVRLRMRTVTALSASMEPATLCATRVLTALCSAGCMAAATTCWRGSAAQHPGATTCFRSSASVHIPPRALSRLSPGLCVLLPKAKAGPNKGSSKGRLFFLVSFMRVLFYFFFVFFFTFFLNVLQAK